MVWVNIQARFLRIDIMARVTVKLFATVREAARTPECVVEADTVTDLVESLKKRFGKEFAKTVAEAERDPDRLVILVNGENAGIARRGCITLRDGDEVALFPPVSGG